MDFPTTLPDSKSPALVLVNPSEEEKIAQWKTNATAWRGPLSLEAYIRREEHLANVPFTKDGGITWWVLVDTAAEERKVLSGCESLRKRALVSKDSNVKEIICHGIGSVFCPPEFRGRGYAGRMMQELGKTLRTWQTTESLPCSFSILYSDIGKQFYAGHGWKPFSSAHISLPASPPLSGKLSNLPRARPLYADDLPELCKADEELIRETMLTMTKRGKTTVALVPDLETIRWHHSREDFLTNEFYGKYPKVKGAIVGSEKGKRVWCYWTRMYSNPGPQETKGNTLHILRLVIEGDGTLSWGATHDPEASVNGIGGEVAEAYVPEVTALLAAAQRQAAEWHMADVQFWNPTHTTVKAFQLIEPLAKVVNRDKESIASLMWYGKQSPAGDVPVDAIEWISNEKYGWC